jgi:hypothetical protein
MMKKTNLWRRKNHPAGFPVRMNAHPTKAGTLRLA